MNNNKAAQNNKLPWQNQLSSLVTDPAELIAALKLDPALLPAAIQSTKLFPLKVPRVWLAKIEPGNLRDPLLQQVLPLLNEQESADGYVTDPLGEQDANPVPGLLHKYQSRVLITLTSACAIHCRYCFRRHFPYEDNQPGRAGWQAIFDYIAAHPEINEVILSGGDPLTVPDRLFAQFTDGLRAIHHIKTLRIHTRVPVVMPDRVTDDLVELIADLPFKKIIVIHANHAREITDEVQAVLQKLHLVNVTLLNQAVLLKDINDDATILTELSERLFACDVLPYYLHLLDKVQGAAHFDLPLAAAKALHAELSKRLPGYLVPKLVREVAGEGGKTLV